MRNIQQLEARCLFAAVAWDGGGDAVNWYDPMNWTGDVLPGQDDAVAIPAGFDAPLVTGKSTQIGSLDIAGALTVRNVTVRTSGGVSVDGKLNAVLTGNLIIGGDLTVEGEVRLGDASDDSTGWISMDSTDPMISGNGLIEGVSTSPAQFQFNAIFVETFNRPAGRTLTIGAGIIVRATAGAEFGIGATGSSPSRLINQGTIEAVGQGATMNVGAHNWTSGDLTNIDNQGVIRAQDKSLLIMGRIWTTQTPITITDAARLQHAGRTTGEDLGRVVQTATSGGVFIRGDVNGSLYIDHTAGGSTTLEANGYIDGPISGSSLARLRVTGGVIASDSVEVPVDVVGGAYLTLRAADIRLSRGLNIGDASGTARVAIPTTSISGTTIRFTGKGGIIEKLTSGTTTLVLGSDTLVRHDVGATGTIGVDVVVSSASILASGAGSLQVNGRLMNLGQLRATAGGTLRILNLQGDVGSARADGPGSNLRIGGSYTIGSILVQQDAALVLSGTPSLGATGRVDLDGLLIVDYPASNPQPGANESPSPYSQWLDAIRRSLRYVTPGGQGQLSTPRPWAGPGVGSSRAAADTRFAVGLAEATEILSPAGGQIGGVSTDGSSLVMRLTLKGDLNLDRSVNFSDLVILARNYGKSADARWTEGDADYDGRVDFQDLVALAGNYGTSVPPVSTSNW